MTNLCHNFVIGAMPPYYPYIGRGRVLLYSMGGKVLCIDSCFFRWYNFCVKIELTKEQIKFARDLAAKRHEAKDTSFRNSKRLHGNIKKTRVDHYVLDITHKAHFLGVLGEMAYAQAVNEKIDTNIYEIRDKGFDVGEMEVKASTWMNGDIELKVQKKHFETKFPKKYILVRIDENNFNIIELIGEISREDFDKHKVIKQYRPNYPVNYIVGTEYLKPIEKLKI